VLDWVVFGQKKTIGPDRALERELQMHILVAQVGSCSACELVAPREAGGQRWEVVLHWHCSR
jgi:hypothetical protein